MGSRFGGQWPTILLPHWSFVYLFLALHQKLTLIDRGRLTLCTSLHIAIPRMVHFQDIMMLPSCGAGKFGCKWRPRV
ncbi:hypothetical protein BDR05DRAFT_544768 [Suillus weaverae]|nr:hypothetical protein BDR05DRAFT_544768 [Suillus weaverae]